MERPALAREGSVCLVELKELARRHLKSNSPVRILILSEPDYIPEWDAPAKVKLFSKLLWQELRPEPG